MPCVCKMQYLTSVHWFRSFCDIWMYPSVAARLVEDGQMSGRNMYEVHHVCNILSYTDVHLLVLATISNVNVPLGSINCGQFID
jgi:hypothetical protein